MAIVGPRFSNPDRYSLSLSGTKLFFNLPPHSHPRTPVSIRKGKNFNLYDKKYFSVHSNSKKKDILYCNFLSYVWSYCQQKLGIFSSDVGKCYFNFEVFSMPEFSSLFRVPNLECAIERMIFSHGDVYTSSSLARQNWRIEEYNGIDWIAFENDGKYSAGGMYNPCESVIQTFYIIPVSDEHMLVFYFTRVTQKEVFGLNDAFSELSQKIMSSTKVEFSEESVRQKKEVELNFPGQKYSRDLSSYEFELDTGLNDNQIMDKFLEEKGSEYVIALSQSNYEQEVAEYKQQLTSLRSDQLKIILESHLRFKK